MKLTILGCGTSGGVPKIPEYWGTCDPAESKNRRRRASILIEHQGTHIVIDTSPDFREQMLAASVKKVDAILYTHDHADHTNGIDDLRGYFHAQKAPVPVYSDKKTLTSIRSRFGYVFTGAKGYPSIAEAREINGAFTVGDIDITPFSQQHGPVTSLGFRLGGVAYSTDLDGLDEVAFNILEGVDVWIVDALRREPHPTHAHLEKTLEWIRRVQPKRAILTHMDWSMDYQTLKRELPPGCEPAYDGMRIEILP